MSLSLSLYIYIYIWDNVLCICIYIHIFVYMISVATIRGICLPQCPRGSSHTTSWNEAVISRCLYYTMMYCTVLHCAALHYNIYCNVLSHTIQYYTVLYNDIPYYDITPGMMIYYNTRELSWLARYLLAAKPAGNKSYNFYSIHSNNRLFY